MNNGNAGTHQFVKDAAVKLLLGTTAVEKGLVVVLEAVDVSLELLHAVGVDILDTVTGQPRAPSHPPVRSIMAKLTR